MAVLSEVSVEVRPPSLAPLGHVVASQQKLRRHLRGLFAVLYLHSGFDGLSEGHGVARPTSLLVSDSSGEIVAVDASPVEVLGQFRVRNFFVVLVLLLELLSLLHSFWEMLAMSESQTLSFIGLAFCLSKIYFIL